jgi:hypothetical protein
MENTVSRPRKLKNIETIWYEMDMLGYCYRRLRERKFEHENAYWLCIKGFLLHYRNLAQFFGNHTGLRAGTWDKWSNRALSDSEAASIQSTKLHDEYDSPISRYLCPAQACLHPGRRECVNSNKYVPCAFVWRTSSHETKRKEMMSRAECARAI